MFPGDVVEVSFVGSDPDGDDLTFFVTSIPSVNVSIDATDGDLYWAIPKDYLSKDNLTAASVSMIVEVADTKQSASSIQFVVQVSM